MTDQLPRPTDPILGMACWGHRGGTAEDYAENSLASFEAALSSGVDGIESDVRLLKDGVIVLHHDAAFGHTVSAKGDLSDWTWSGNVENLRLKRDPSARLPRIEELLDLLMRPGYSHVVFNIDLKPQNPPEIVALIHDHVVRAGGDDYLRTLAPRLVLSIYAEPHLTAAEQHMPYAKKVHLGSDLDKSRALIDRVDGFSMYFSNLALPGGDRFRRECRAAGKSLAVWTVNTPYEWLECARWGADCVITDRNDDYRAWQARVASDPRTLKRIQSPNSTLTALQLVQEVYRALDGLVWQRQMIKDAQRHVTPVSTPRLSPKLMLLFGGKRAANADIDPLVL